MIQKKSREEIKLMKHAGNIVALVHKEMKNVVAPGISTLELDQIAYKIIKDNKAIPSFLGYRGFVGSICASINEEVVHGIPSDKKILKEGDIISIDVGATYRGLVGDGAWTYPVGKISEELQNLLKGTEESLMAAISKVKDGVVLDEVSGAVEDVAKKYGFGIVREYGGHGVGRSMHEDPFIFNYRTKDKRILKSGYCLAIEPMLNLGCDEVYTNADNWTVSTKDHMASAHFEHSVLVDDNEAVILTALS